MSPRSLDFWCALLALALAIAPARAQAAALEGSTARHQFMLGLGGVRGNCEFNDAAGKKICLKGERLVLAYGFSVYERGGAKSRDAEFDGDKGGSEGSGDSTASVRGNSSHWYNNSCPSSGGNCGSGKDAAALLVVAAIALVLFGIWWLLFSVFADRLKVGLVYSTDFQSDNLFEPRNYFESYRVQRFGARLGVYLVPKVDMELFATATASDAVISRKSAEDGSKSSFSIHGFSSSFGIGRVPYANRRGVFGYLEFERNFFSAGRLRAYVDQQNEPILAPKKDSGAFILGWAF